MANPMLSKTMAGWAGVDPPDPPAELFSAIDDEFGEWGSWEHETKAKAASAARNRVESCLCMTLEEKVN